MWQDERKKIILRNIILGVLCIALLGGLGYAMYKNSEEAELEKAMLTEQYSSSENSLMEGRHMSMDDIEAEYQKDMDTVAKYLPGIVCWGDTFTAGSSGTVSLPSVLQRYIDTYICDIYDFKASIKDANEYSRLDWQNYKVRIPVINMGVADEDTNTVLGRSGAVPFVLASDVTIPAGTEPVEIEIISQNGSKVSPLSGGNGGVNKITIGEIEGELVLEADHKAGSNKKARYYFTRSSAGKPFEAAAETPVITAASNMYKDYLHIVWMGAFEGYQNEKELVSQIKTLLARQTNNTDRYLVLGLCCKRDWGNFSSYDTAMTQAFGDHYINIRKYLCSDGMIDLEMMPTDRDEIACSLGIVPPSLRNPRGILGLSALAYRAIGKVVYERMEQLGYFDEVVDELYINEIKKEVLKENPKFFTTMIENW